MRGKNKLVLILFAVMALVASSVAFALSGSVKSIRYAKAESVEGYTTLLEGNVIFSAERVYFAVNEEGGSDIWNDKDEDDAIDSGEVIGWNDINSDGIINIGELEGAVDTNGNGQIDIDELPSIRNLNLTYNNHYNFNAIETSQGTEYFGDFGLNEGNTYDYSHKDIISDGEFVMVDDNATYSATLTGTTNTVGIKQGIMITLGGYYYDTEDKEYKLNGENTGANLDYVSAQAFLNGEPIELPNARGYNNSSYQDFTFFIIPSEATEGHYEISVMYPVAGLAKPVRYDFDFYLLLQSSYNKTVEVNSQTYNSFPTMGDSATPITSTNYEFFSGTTLNYPTITFDYARYDLSYTHISGDVTTEVDFDYDEAGSKLSLSQLVYNDTETKYYIIDHGNDNTIVTLMFVDNGKYTFHFDYIYKYQGEKITIPQEQIAFEDITLNIYGYQLKYSKTGFASADMTYLEIYQNSTMFILVNGFMNADKEAIGDNLGVQYKLINDVTRTTGTVRDNANETKVFGSESASIVSTKDANLITDDNAGSIAKQLYDKDKSINNYQRTDRGLWLTLNDEYYLSNDDGVQSFYYHSSTPITADYITAKDEESGAYINRVAINKVTTFTEAGYYLVQVKYKTTNDKVGTQWFAFQITATTPMLELYKTGLEVLAGNADYINENSEEFYAHEYTNQNVYATWAETEIFESSVVGKLYYSSNNYASETALKAVADGTYNSSVTKVDYNKKDLIKDSASYLLVLEVERSASKTYTYFTIDKEKISGLQVYEVVTNSIDNRAIYSIKQDANLDYVVHTSKSVIDANFTLGWADKRSGAGITATYKLTPFVKNNTNTDFPNNPIVIEQGSNIYKYVINEYGISQSSESITIQKPIQLNSALDISNVLTDQGIYEFNLIDQAGNQLIYIVVVDRTEGVVNATYGDANQNGVKNKYISGQLVADYVELEWGTHKAISLGANVNTTIQNLLTNAEIDNYYGESGNNLFNLRTMFQQVGGNNLFVVQNLRTEIRLDSFDEYYDNYYVLTNTGAQQIKYPNGVTTTGWDDDANYLFANATNAGIKINVDVRDGGEGHLYNFSMIGANQVTSTTNTKFTVRNTPDEALGQVYSATQEGSTYDTYVKAKDQGPEYFDNVVSNENIYLEKYYEGQASNDGVFVFEWLVPSDEDNFKVTEVKYNYYQLMDQSELNSITSTDNYPYYPYKYLTTDYILQTEDGMETIAQYTKTTRVTKDGDKVIENRAVNRSNPINLAYETYYDAKGNLLNKQVTQTGLYIITRKIEMKADAGQSSQPLEYSYAFFVDRNMIVGYSITDINNKIVGQFIHTAMPNSESATGVKYDNFTKQGLTKYTQTYGADETVSYQVYLETNKLPTRLQVPSGKYVSGNVDDMTINATSHLNLNLKLSVYFYDSYRLLPNAYNGTFVRLMSDLTSNKDGYIDLNFKNIDDEALITIFRNARIHSEDSALSLPGTYVFVIEDTVSSKLNSEFEVYDTNEFIFGIKLTNNAPQTDVYTYAEIDDKTSSKIYAEDNILYTNQEFVDFVIPVEDLSSYEAQLDIASIEIWRSSATSGGTSLWLRLKPNANGGFVADTNAIIQNLDRIYWVDKDGKVINQEDADAKERLAGYVIKLDTGLTVVDNRIVEYKEYVYIINIKYILTNSGIKYYTYKDEGITTSFHTTEYRVEIDRSPNSTNLDALMQEQGEYFENYQQWLAENNNAQASSNVNENFAYRSTTTVGDYYGLANKLYYDFASTTGNLANQAMFALTVGYNSTFNPNGLSEIYYRKLDFNSSVVANTRMGLLPITDTYFEVSDYYHTFSENKDVYGDPYYTGSTAYKDAYGNIYYRALMNGNGSNQDMYKNNCGVFYEIIEKDMAGNLTQYVIYFAPSESSIVGIDVKGKLMDHIGGYVYVEDDSDTDDDIVNISFEFVNNGTVEQGTFIGINNIVGVTGLVGKKGQDDNINLYPYYGNINIYNASRQNIKTIYTNSTSIHDIYNEDGKTLKTAGLENEIYEVIKEQGNYIIEYRNVFGESYTLIVDNYTSDNHKLNTSTLEVKTDSITGQKYITLSSLNTKIDENTYWYVKEVTLSYYSNTESITYITDQIKGKTTLQLSSGNEGVVTRDTIESDRLNLEKGVQYLVTLTDVGGEPYVIPISTSDDYYAYKLITPDNIYARDNVVYTANSIQLSYNTDFYDVDVKVFLGDNTIPETSNQSYYDITIQSTNYKLLTLIPDTQTNPADHYGSLRRFVVTLLLNGEKESQTYEIYIDTRATDFVIENTNKVDKIDYIKSTLKNDADENGIYDDYRDEDLSASKYYGTLIAETINISWTRLTNDYFTYKYQLLKFTSKDDCVDLLEGSSATEHPIRPGEEGSIGKYVLKVTIEGKDGTWIATRVYGIFMSTTITGLYEVKDSDGNLYDYVAITNLTEVIASIGSNKTAMKDALGFSYVDEMESAFTTFGYYTAIPMYIANTELTLHSNQDNGVSSLMYQPTGSSYAIISFYRVYRSNYYTFAVIMEVYPTGKTQNILSTLSITTSSTKDGESLLNNGTSKIIYDADAEYYKLTFSSYNRNTASNPLERRNKIIIDVYYNNVFAKRIKGDVSNPTTPIEFKNSGSYKLIIRDEAGNVQYFSNATSTIDNFTVVVMKDMLYTINGEAPIQYAYYDSDVTLQINRYNDATGKNNYDINTIRLSAIRNSSIYTGYEHPTESATYIFKDYGTYLITISAKLLGSDEEVSSQLVFTILNPNEARNALDFTSIYGYNIISVFSVTKTAEKDVTDKFMELLQDKSNVGEVTTYNKLITYDRVAEAFGTATQGKMKFRVLYEVENDDLLPARMAEFSFTLNNETATINSSIQAGGKTTKDVTLKFNAANIYDQIGDCNLVINGEVVLRIDENSANQITEIKVTDVGKYYIQLMGDSGNVATSFNFTIKEPLNTMAIILIVVISAIVVALIGTFIWLRTRMKVR